MQTQLTLTKIYQIKFISGAPGIRSRFATLIVLVPPEMPKIVQGDYMVTTEGREIELECISHGGKPAAEVILTDFFFCFVIYEIFCINRTCVEATHACS